MIIRKFEERDLEQVKAICFSAFSLTAFHNDPVFTAEQAGALIWELYARPAVTNSRNYCLVCEDNSEVQGFIVYGSYGELAKLPGRRTASIVLLAVKKEQQNSGKKIGHTLVYNCLSLFRKNDVKLVSVGTDLNNLAAQKIYSSTEFYPALYWSTWRFHSGPSVFPETTTIQAIFGVPEEVTKKNGARLVSFLEDPFFSDAEKQKIREWYLRPKESSDMMPLEVMSSGKSAGFVLLEKEKTVSDLTGRQVFRIDGVYGPDPSAERTLVEGALKHCSTLAKEFTVEMFLRSDDWRGAKTLGGLGFSLVHNSVTLHCRL